MLAAPLAAQDGPKPVLAAGETLEVQTRADLNGDGITDFAYVARGEGKRELHVVTSYRNEVEMGENPPQILALDYDPLVDAELRVTDNVLLLEDLTGGTSAVGSTHRFRWDAKLGAMRLIGLDATLYSRTYSHDGLEDSWNLLTGALVTRILKLNTGLDGPAYTKVGEKRSKKPSKSLRLENAPTGDDLLGWPCSGEHC